MSEIVLALPRVMTLEKAEEVFGFTICAMQNKIKRGVWVEGREVEKLDGKWVVITPGVEKAEWGRNGR